MRCDPPKVLKVYSPSTRLKVLGNVVTVGMITVSTKAGGLDNILFTDIGKTDVS